MGMPLIVGLISLVLILLLIYKQVKQTAFGGVPEKTSLIYLIMGIFWILLSDKMLDIIVADAGRISNLQTYKGWFYVLITSVVLYLILSKYMKELDISRRELSVTSSELRQYGILIEEQMEEKEKSLKALNTSERRYKSLYEAISGGVIVQDRAGRVIDANDVAMDILGITKGDIETANLNGTIINCIYTDGRSLTRENQPAMMAIKTGKPVRNVTLGIMHPLTQQYRWILVNAQPVIDSDEAPREVVTTFLDITDLKSAEETILYQTYHDPLTGLPNRAHFNDKLTQLISRFHRRKKTFAILYIDLDRFKHINDSLGHNVGDEILKGVAELLRNFTCPDDTVARLGGDEFVLLLQDINHLEAVSKLAKEIINHFKIPIGVLNHEIHITPSIGIAIYPNDGSSTIDLLKNAEIAMYNAKASGKNKYIFYSKDLNEKVNQRHQLENSMRKALEREDFELYYQPQVDLLTNEIIGVEALIRWHHQDLGMILPTDFIPIAEETGLIIPMEEWVLKTACSQIEKWQKKYNRPLRLAVNISPHHFQHRNLLKTVIKTIHNTGFDGGLLELEITETAAMQNVEFTIKVIDDLRRMGIEICIDDFGTGYSSLGYLKKFTIQKLKIDRSFVKNLIENTNDAAITDAVIALAHSLNLLVVAEGVETEEQLKYLRNKKCDFIQGYYFKPPIPAKEMEELLASKLKTQLPL